MSTAHATPALATGFYYNRSPSPGLFTAIPCARRPLQACVHTPTCVAAGASAQLPVLDSTATATPCDLLLARLAFGQLPPGALPRASAVAKLFLPIFAAAPAPAPSVS